MTRRTWLVVLLIVVLLLNAAAALLNGETLFYATGKEELTGQLRGVLQLALGQLRPQPDTQPGASIPHADVNPFGINTFLEQEVELAKRERQVELIADAGFYWIRQEFPWEDIEIHGKGDWVDRRNDPAGIDAWAKYDHIVDLADRYGLQIIARLSNPPAWSRAAGDEAGSFAPPDDVADYGDFVAAVVSRYAGRIHYFQIWNEPNIYPEWGEAPVNPEAFTQLLCHAYGRAKEANPDAFILSGALAPTHDLEGRNLNDLVFLQRMYDAGAGDCFDILSVQGYGLWSGPTDRRQHPTIINFARHVLVRDLMVQNGDAHKAIWISEMNWNPVPDSVLTSGTYGQVTPEQAARYAPLAYARAEREWPWIGVINFWFFKRATDAEREQEWYYFRMLEPDFTPTPVYYSMRDHIHRHPTYGPGRR
jgi:polysaccharide biosynthesis protein PslG